MLLIPLYTFLLSPLAVLTLVITYFSIKKSQTQQFYSDTFLLTPLGIFVWGDGIILGPFWLITTLLWWGFDLAPIWIVRYFLLFWIVRSFYEVMYWLLHQSNNHHYSPPIGRNIAWLKLNEQRILYQVFHTCVVTFALFLFIYSLVGRP